MFGPPARFVRSASVLAVITLLLAALLLAAKGLNRDVGFTGGMFTHVQCPEALSSKSVQDRLVGAGFADAAVKEITTSPSFFYIILPPSEEVLSPPLGPRLVRRVIAALSTDQRRPEIIGSVEVVTPTVGREVLLLGLLGAAAVTILACVAMMIHSAVRRGWRFALSAGVTYVRNMAIILGLFLAAYAGFQWEFSLPSLTAICGLALLVGGISAVYASPAGPSR